MMIKNKIALLQGCSPWPFLLSHMHTRLYKDSPAILHKRPPSDWPEHPFPNHMLPTQIWLQIGPLLRLLVCPLWPPSHWGTVGLFLALQMVTDHLWAHQALQGDEVFLSLV